MTDLIKITTDATGSIAVGGRELHEFLGVETRYDTWFNRMVEYGFAENQDFEAIAQKRATAQGNETTFTDHAISIDMAKEICMIQRTDKGKEARRYFIDCERKLREEKLPPPLPPLSQQQVFAIDGIPIHIPSGVLLTASVSRTKAGTVTVRVKTTTSAPAKEFFSPPIDSIEKMHYNIINLKGGDSDCPQKTKPYKSD